VAFLRALAVIVGCCRRDMGRAPPGIAVLAAAGPLGVLGVPGVARADHPTDSAGGVWPLASLLLLALAFALVWAMSAILESRQKPRPDTEEPGGSHQ
jgi:hypothetical protein